MTQSASTPDRRHILEDALRALEKMQARLDAAEAAQREPIAIVGLGCRFPGDANDAETYWKLMRDGVDAIGEVPTGRWSVDEYFDADRSVPGKVYTRWGGFVRDIDCFDPQFFGIAPREATLLDPQHRLLLEVAWEALENAGQSPAELAGGRTGVFVGIHTSDYLQQQLQRADRAPIDAYLISGNSLNGAAGRISYTLGLQGPSIAIDTACSSSLVAIHLACQSLRTGDCDLALAGGVNILLAPELYISLCKWGVLAPDGRCKTFDAGADGFIRSEGCGLVVLKRLSEAVSRGDNILAVIRGSAVNQDGASSGFSVPNGLAQQDMLRRALASARVAPHEVSYVEAHGTGTALGDPIEVEALAAVLGEKRPPDQRLQIGSVKTNFGHLESAAGIAGLIKVVLALQHGAIPPHLHLQAPSRQIPWAEIPIDVPTSLTPWSNAAGPRIAGVSSFGFSGTNAHVILAEAPAPVRAAISLQRPRHVLALSARSEPALQELAGRYAAHIAAHPEQTIADICHTANMGRSHFAQRLALVAEDANELQQKLAAVAGGATPTGALRSAGEVHNRPKVALLFSGQGADHANLGRQLYESQPTFRATIDRCEVWLKKHAGLSLIDSLYPDETTAAPKLQGALSQLALYAVQMGLAQLWRAWGIEPAVVLGHSLGEYAAAATAGVLSLEDGLKLVARRAQLMDQLPPGGGMAAVRAESKLVAAAIAPYPAVAIAAINGLEDIVVSGPREDVERIVAELSAQGVVAKYLHVSQAFHSPLVEPMLAEFARSAAEIEYTAPRIPLVSNLTGRLLRDDERIDGDYWRRHARHTVQFAAGLDALFAEGCQVLVEIGPARTLTNLARRAAAARGQQHVHCTSSLDPTRDDWSPLLESVAALYTRGAAIDWRAFDRDYAGRLVALPTYPFQRKRYWFQEATTAAAPRRTDRAPGAMHPLLDRCFRSPVVDAVIYESALSAAGATYLADHRLQDRILLPATAMLEMALAAGSEFFGGASCRLADVAMRQPLVLPESGDISIQLILRGQDSEQATFELISLAAAGDGQSSWTLHATGKTIRETHACPAASPEIDLAQIRTRCAAAVEVQRFYGRLADRGCQFGPRFRGLARLWRGASGEALGQIQFADSLALELANYGAHPSLLDACIQVLASTWDEASPAGDELYVPVGIGGVRLFRSLDAPIWSYARLREERREQGEALCGDVWIFDDAGQLVAQLDAVTFKRLRRESTRGAKSIAPDWFYHLAWQAQPLEPAALPPAAEPPRQWIIFADSEGFGAALAARLNERGACCHLVVPGVAGLALESHNGAPHGARRFAIDPTNAEDYRRIFHEIAAGGAPVGGIVHLWGLSSEVTAELELEQIERSVETACRSGLFVTQALLGAAVEGAPRLWFVTRGAHQVDESPALPNVAAAPLWGLARVIAQEHPELRCARFDLDPEPRGDDIEHFVGEIEASGQEDEICYRNSLRYVARLRAHDMPSAPMPLDAAGQRVQAARPGALDSLELAACERRAPAHGEVEICVLAAGLNFRDVLRALGVYPGESGPLGDECAGVITAIGAGVQGFEIGAEVLAITPGSMGTYVTASAVLVKRKPQCLGFVEATTLPTAFTTTWHALYDLGQITRGTRVLIHAAAGGVGMAAVQLALRAGAEVFATAGRPEKHAALRAMGVQHIMSSRDTTFADEILRLTAGQGVDFVLNSLSGEFIPRSLAALRDGGRFVEIGKRDIWTHEQVAALGRDIEYFIVDLAPENQTDLAKVGDIFARVVAAAEAGDIEPLPRHEFRLDQAEEAFRFMAQAKHIGRIVLTSPPTAAQRGAAIHPDGSYLVTGGLSGLGLATAEWLVAQGARHVALLARRDASTMAQAAIGRMECAGAQVVVLKKDLAIRQDVADALAEIARDMPALRGIVHAAGVLEDGAVLHQDWERFARVLRPKVQGAWHLHTLSSDLPLDFFVLYSSMTSLLGTRGQANYAAANAFLDSLAQYRHMLGLPALSINWGAWSEVGRFAERNLAASSAHRAVGLIATADGLAAFGQALEQKLPQLGIMSVDWSKYGRGLGQAGPAPMLAELVSATKDATPIGRKRTVDPHIIDALAAAPAARRDGLLRQYIAAQAAKVLDLETGAAIDLRLPLHDLGLDSLMAVELRNVLSAGLARERQLPASLLFDFPTVDDLAIFLAREVLGYLDFGAATDSREPDAVAVANDRRTAARAEIEQLSEEETAELLLQELSLGKSSPSR